MDTPNIDRISRVFDHNHESYVVLINLEDGTLDDGFRFGNTKIMVGEDLGMENWIAVQTFTHGDPSHVKDIINVAQHTYDGESTANDVEDIAISHVLNPLTTSDTTEELRREGRLGEALADAIEETAKVAA